MKNLYTTRRLLMLGGGPMQVSVFEVARKLGLETVCVDPAPNAVCRTLADHFHNADLADADTLEQIALQHGVHGVMTLAADYPLDAASILCAKLGLSGPSPEAVALVRDKARLRKHTAGALPSTPRWKAFDALAEAQNCALIDESDCVVKPVDSSGGRGVHQVKRGSQPEERLAALQAAFAASKRGRIVVEEFVSGPEYSVESFTFAGKTRIVAVTEKTTSGAPYFVEIRHVVPAKLSRAESAAIEAFVGRVIELTGVDQCATHIEVKLTPNGPVLIEMAARLGGGYINTDLVPLALGVDMVKAAIDAALGIAPHLEPTRSRAAAIRFLIPQPGIFLRVDGIDEAESLAGVHRIVCGYSGQDNIGIVRDATNRKSYLIVHADDTDAARHLVDEAAAKITFEMGPT